LPVGGGPDCAEQLVAGHVLQQVAGRAGFDSGYDVAVGVVGGQDEQRAATPRFASSVMAARPFIPGIYRSVRITSGHNACAIRIASAPSPASPTTLELALRREHPAQLVSDHRMVVRDQQPDHAGAPAAVVGTLAEIAVPDPGSDSISRVPSRATYDVGASLKAEGRQMIVARAPFFRDSLCTDWHGLLAGACGSGRDEPSEKEQPR
jgi:hypothetical protein